jgi:hypothetical protein
MTCDHINRVRDDNRIENLRWASSSQQYENRRQAQSKSGATLYQVSQTGVLIRQFQSKVEAAKKLGIGRNTVYAYIASKKILACGSMLVCQLDQPEAEEWKTLQIDGVSLQVSSLGRVKNSAATEGSVNTNGYMVYSFKGKKRYVHRLVARAFLGEPQSQDLVVHHIDSNRRNNKISNLEWVTLKENSQRSVDEGKLGRYRRKIAQCDDDGIVLQVFESVTSASKAVGGKKPSDLHAAVRKGMKYKGYRWKLLEKGVQPTMTGGGTAPARTGA